jgi:hypothetical protein
MVMASDNSSSPDGLIWNGDNYNCAYDALLTILYEVWSADTKAWTRRFKEINQCHLKSVSACFKKYMNGQASFETARDTIRNELHSQSPALFPYGIRGTSVSALASAIPAPQNFVAISSPECTSCEYSEASIDDRLDFVLYGIKTLGDSIRAFHATHLDSETHSLMLWKLDIAATYQQIPMHPLWQIKQAITINDYFSIDQCNNFGGHASQKIWWSFISLALWIAVFKCNLCTLKCYFDDNFSFYIAGDLKLNDEYDAFLPSNQVHLLQL